MTIESLIRDARVLWRAEGIVAQLRLHDLLTRLGLRAIAAVIAIFGLLMLELAAYFAMVQVWNAVTAALLLAAANFLIGLAVLLLSMRKRSTDEHESAAELQRLALSVLQADAAELFNQFQSYKRAFSHPLDATLASLAVPAAGLLVKALRKAVKRPAGSN